MVLVELEFYQVEYMGLSARGRVGSVLAVMELVREAMVQDLEAMVQDPEVMGLSRVDMVQDLEAMEEGALVVEVQGVLGPSELELELVLDLGDMVWVLLVTGQELVVTGLVVTGLDQVELVLVVLLVTVLVALDQEDMGQAQQGLDQVGPEPGQADLVLAVLAQEQAAMDLEEPE
ncbi:hypothetical protein NQZ68_010492 [Dissostichus eleginoides]|nr:hypothetical protein NQZ68_010492 [Dissostichus eleginoides]